MLLNKIYCLCNIFSNKHNSNNKNLIKFRNRFNPKLEYTLLVYPILKIKATYYIISKRKNSKNIFHELLKTNYVKHI